MATFTRAAARVEPVVTGEVRRPPVSRRKRWVAVGVLWLLLSYPLSAAPAAYCVGRGWVGLTAVSTAYRPLFRTLGPTPLGEVWYALNRYFGELGERHRVAG